MVLSLFFSPRPSRKNHSEPAKMKKADPPPTHESGSPPKPEKYSRQEEKSQTGM